VLRSYKSSLPRIEASAWIAPSADVIGDVVVGAESSIWYGCVVRGDIFPIRIGVRTNVQDLTTIHVTHGRYATILHDDVTIGHRVVLHGCTIESGALVGIGAIVLDQAVIGEGALVAAGSLVPPRMHVPAGMMALGSPARVVRAVSDAERAWMQESARNYVEYARQHAAAD